MLGGNDHGIHPNGAVVLIILHRHLALAVGPQIGELPALADLGEPLGQLLGQRQRQRHQLRRLVAGIAEHHALVAGAVAQLAVGSFLVLQGLVHAQGDVGGLLINGGDDATGIAVKAVFAPVIADVPDHFPGDLGDVHVAVGGDLAHDVDQSGADRGLAGHPAIGILLQDRVQNSVGDLVADFVGMSLGHRLRGKQIMSCHVVLLLLCVSLSRAEKNARFDNDETRTCCLLAPHLSVSAGFGTLQRRLPWFHRAVPSATLDKG